jgi:hypothetical protein
MIYEEKGKLDCHSALDFLEEVIPGFLNMQKDLQETGEKLKAEGDQRGQKMLMAARLIQDVHEHLTDIKLAINGGFYGILIPA